MYRFIFLDIVSWDPSSEIQSQTQEAVVNYTLVAQAILNVFPEMTEQATEVNNGKFIIHHAMLKSPKGLYFMFFLVFYVKRYAKRNNKAAPYC